MTMEQKVAEALNSGIEPMELCYKPVYSRQTEKATAFFSELHLNSTILGLLRPDQYEVVADRTIRSEKLSIWALTYASRAVNKISSFFPDMDFIAVRCPARAAKIPFVKSVERLFIKTDFDFPGKLCVMLPPSILFEDPGEIKGALLAFKNLKVKTMLYGFGDEFCPAARLFAFPFDYVAMHPSLTKALKDPSAAHITASMINLVRSGGAKTILTDAENDGTAYEISRTECFGYTKKSEFESLNKVLRSVRGVAPDG